MHSGEGAPTKQYAHPAVWSEGQSGHASWEQRPRSSCRVSAHLGLAHLHCCFLFYSRKQIFYFMNFKNSLPNLLEFIDFRYS